MNERQKEREDYEALKEKTIEERKELINTLK